MSIIALGCSYYLLRSPAAAPAANTPVPPASAVNTAKSTPPENLVVESELAGDRFSAKIEGNHVEYRVTGEFAGNFRVFGVSPNETENSPTSHISAFVRLVRLADARAALAREGCERGVAQKAKTVGVVVTDDKVASRLEEFVPSGGELKISGKILEMESHEFAGHAFKFSSSDIDLGKIYLLSTVEEVSDHETPPLAAPESRLASRDPAPDLEKGTGYKWNFSGPDQVRQGQKVAPRPTCKKKRIVRIIRRCPR